MPTIDVSIRTLEKLSGKKFTEEHLEIVKGELESRDGDRARIEVGDSNRPDMWSVEGIARVLSGYYNKKKGMPTLRVKKSGKKILVDKKMSKIRPYIFGFIAKNIRMTDQLLKELIQLQDKLDQNYGRKRKRVSIGLYDSLRITFPVHYMPAKPHESFTPLGHEVPLTLDEILQKHEKGLTYGHIIKDFKEYPLCKDDAGEVLSLTPIINSAHIGKVMPGMDEIFVEMTGTDFKAVSLVLNVVAYAFSDRGATIESVDVVYPDKRITTPLLQPEKKTFDKKHVARLLGIELSDKEIIDLLLRMQYNAVIKKEHVTVEIPPYRNDVMHYADIIEDIAMCYGYSRMADLPIESFTVGNLREETLFYGRSKRIMIGLGFQEILSPILSNHDHLCTNMETKEKIIEIQNVMSETYSAVRNWMLPSVLLCLTKNMHVEYPQRVFELGECVIRDNTSLDYTRTVTKLAACVSNSAVGYDEISAFVDSFLSNFGISYELVKTQHNTFITGRVAKILVHKKEIGIVGEIHPQVLNNWKIEKPTAGFEIDIDQLFLLSTRK